LQRALDVVGENGAIALDAAVAPFEPAVGGGEARFGGDDDAAGESGLVGERGQPRLQRFGEAFGELT